MLKLKQQDSVKDQFSSMEIMTVYGMYIMETVFTVRQPDYMLPKFGSTHSYLSRLPLTS